MIHSQFRVKVVLATILILHLFILSKLIFFPYPEFFVYPYLTNQGLKPYSQILDQHFPGLMFLPINFDNLGMRDPDVARGWLMVIVIITHLLIFFITKAILKSEKKALLVNLLYLLWQPFFEGWIFWIDTFLPLFLLPALYATYKRLVFWAGLFLGIGVVFKQVLVPLSFLIFLYLYWQSRSFKKASFFLLGFLAPILMMLLYLSSINVLGDFWYWTIVFNLTTFAEFGRKPPFFTGLLRVGFVLVAASLMLFSKRNRQTEILILFIMGSLVTIFARFDFVHFQPALPFVLMATVSGFSAIQQKPIFKWVSLGYLAVAFWWMIIFFKGHLSSKIFFFDEQTLTIAQKVKRYTDDGDKIFIFGSVPHLYQMTKTLPAGNVFVFQFPWFMQVSEDRILEAIQKDPPKIVVADRTVVIEGQKIINYAKKIDQYILENYQPIDQAFSTKILQRKSP